MKDFITRFWLEAIFTAVLGLMGWLFRNYSKKFKKQELEQSAIRGGMVALLRYRIIETYNQYAEKKYCPIYALENVNSLYLQYHALGGNGTVTHLVEELRELPHSK